MSTSSLLSSVGAAQQKAENFEAQLATMQMEFQTKMEAAKAEKSAAEALGNQQG